ncbi:hypothetical protein MMC30_005887 [Neofusicoccum parvum]|uniref:Uncharacterized protein n=1 Tax=Neofusicoccum parvum TaxID=310453 RepID=A0ACB5S291_9PEZI|nr:hypothetical protein MMC30_005887 [Neofusicoccum parvum]
MALLTQPNQKPALQDFTTWFESAKVMGVADLSQPDGPSAQPARTESVDTASDSGSSSLVESPGAPHSPASAALSAREPSSPLTTASGYFIPDLKVKELTVAGIRKMLRALWPDDLPVQVETVQADYAKVFCILLRIAQGYFIEHFVKHDSLCDSKLPFEAKPPNFPPSPDDELFAQFYAIQWMFCAPTFRYNKINQEWNNYILPIILKEDLARGGTATTSKIMLHGAYNRLDPTGDTDKSKANLFVLKTYRTKDAAEHYKSEVEAYRKLRPIGNNSPGLTGFYGSFIHNGTFNIILEFADQGTLNEFFERVTPPSTTKDIRDFWSAMFNLIGAIMTIHNLQVQEENGQDEDDCLSFRG